MKKIVTIILCTVVLAACGSKLEPPPVSKVIYLEQGWDKKDRDWYHYASQGTATLQIPFEWFMALEQPEIKVFGEVGMVSDPDWLEGFGFFGFERNEYNQSGLPLGITIDFDFTDPTTGDTYNALGFSCAACHTGQLVYNNTAMRVDGGSTNANVIGVVIGIIEALGMTDAVPWRFSRFAERVLAEQNTEENRKILRQQIKDTLEKFATTTVFPGLEHPGTIPNGYGRVDALNLIGNQVFGTDARRPENYAASNAPVNYPPIWTTSWFRWVQYDGSVMQVEVRNTGEALGVMAPVNLTAHDTITKFRSTVRFNNIHQMEEMLAGKTPPRDMSKYTGLRSPKWPQDILPAIDHKLAKEGGELYNKLCQECHGHPVGSKEFANAPNWIEARVDWDKHQYGKKNPYQTGISNYQFYRNPLVNLDMIGTDPGQATILRTRNVNTAPDVLPEVEICLCTTDTTKHPSYEYTCGPTKYTATKESPFSLSLGLGVGLTVNKWFDDNNFTNKERALYDAFTPNCLRAEPAYRTRPLNGIWATPPFLHNGSVPTLYDLLSPVEKRPKVFYTGSMEFDPIKVGYSTEKVKGAFKFDTSIEGNLNTGHEFNDGTGKGIIGPKLTEGEKKALVEYLKTL